MPSKGIPKNLKNTVIPFDYNKFDQLEKIVKNNKIGVIKMEVQREAQQKIIFKKVRNLATKNKIVLIFDDVHQALEKHLAEFIKNIM